MNRRCDLGRPSIVGSMSPVDFIRSRWVGTRERPGLRAGQWRALLACSGVALVVTLLLLMSPSAASARGPVRVGLFGDALAVQSEPYFNFLLQAGGEATVSDFAYGGTAACDWLPKNARICTNRAPEGSGL